jgi:aldehyde dehydrogenase (NAD+)
MHVVLKPADLVPGSAWAIADILHRAGLPAGVFNLVMGRGSEVGQVLLDDRRVNAISFTGSVATGQRIAAACVARMAKFQLEMGGKNPMVVLDDADLDVAVNAAVNSGFFSTGQRCTASSRLIVTEGIHDRFVDAMAKRIATLKVDDARKAGTEVGPVVDEKQLAQDLEYIAIGKGEGARLVAGGEAIAKNGDGAPGPLPAPRPVRRHDQGHAHQPRGDLRPGGERAPREELRRKRWPWPTTPSSAWPPASPPPRSSTPRTSSAMRRPAW